LLYLTSWSFEADNLFSTLQKAGIIKSGPVKEALLKVDRSNYSNDVGEAYIDAPQPIGSGQTISAPHMHAHAMEELFPALVRASKTIHDSPQHERDLKILDVGECYFCFQSSNLQSKFKHQQLTFSYIGCGSGYLTAAFGRLVDRNGPIQPIAKGKVYGIEVIPELVDLSRRNIMKKDNDLFESGTVIVAQGDGWTGRPEDGPYDAIHVGAAAESFPTSLMMQLNPQGGCMVIPVGPDGGVQNLYRVERLRDGTTFKQEDFKIKALLGVRYVPLVRLKP
jgi:protein-L-isoaspartate(D-aspartate) O-methyltransferase